MLRSWRLVVVVLMVGAVFASLMAGCGSGSSTSSSSSAASGAPSGEPIKIGLDTALTGIVAAAGEGQSAVAQMFMDDVNASGGLLGRPIELVIEDSASDPKTSNEKAKILVSKGIDVAVGPALSAERTAAEPVFSAAGIPLLYSTWYEGGAYAPLMFIDAETPEQQVNPFVPWLVEKYGPNFYFVGSDYEFPRGQIAMAKKALEAAGGKVVGEEYVALGSCQAVLRLRAHQEHRVRRHLRPRDEHPGHRLAGFHGHHRVLRLLPEHRHAGEQGVRGEVQDLRQQEPGHDSV